MTAYYNEFDPKAAAWLRELIKEGVIAPGDVDERSILQVTPSDLHGYTQCHFFAGVGGWSYALHLARITDHRPVWTASCPCQPLSSAGLRQGDADERHLWPAFFNLIAECGPAEVIGEQVASGDGREWLAGIRADLEGMGYACGAADLCSAGIGAPNIRQRIYWVANANSDRRDPRSRDERSQESAGSQDRDHAQRRGTPAEVAALLDVARETLSRRENGAQKITREAALALLALPLKK